MHYAERTVQGFEICLPRYCNFCLKGVQLVGAFKYLKQKKKTTAKNRFKGQLCYGFVEPARFKGLLLEVHDFWANSNGKVKLGTISLLPFDRSGKFVTTLENLAPARSE